MNGLILALIMAIVIWALLSLAIGMYWVQKQNNAAAQADESGPNNAGKRVDDAPGQAAAWQTDASGQDFDGTRIGAGSGQDFDGTRISAGSGQTAPEAEEPVSAAAEAAEPYLLAAESAAGWQRKISEMPGILGWILLDGAGRAADFSDPGFAEKGPMLAKMVEAIAHDTAALGIHPVQTVEWEGPQGSILAAFPKNPRQAGRLILFLDTEAYKDNMREWISRLDWEAGWRGVQAE